MPCLIEGVSHGIYTIADVRRRRPDEKKILTDTVPYDKVQGRASAQDIHKAIAQAEATNQTSDPDR